VVHIQEKIAGLEASIKITDRYWIKASPLSAQALRGILFASGPGLTSTGGRTGRRSLSASLKLKPRPEGLVPDGDWQDEVKISSNQNGAPADSADPIVTSEFRLATALKGGRNAGIPLPSQSIFIALLHITISGSRFSTRIRAKRNFARPRLLSGPVSYARINKAIAICKGC
jgi:hypothetical protein